MGSGLLRLMEIPDKVEGHGKINLREQALRIADGLIKCKGKINLPLPVSVEYALNKLAPNPDRKGPKYYSDLIRVYDTVLLMVNELTEDDQECEYINGLITALQNYQDKAENKKAMAIREGSFKK